jgi:hypothetical protein
LFFAVSLTVGVRLLALAARSRQAPELLIGLGVLGIGPVGFGLQTVAGRVGDYALAEQLATAGAVAVAVGIWAKLAFNWLVYRRGSRAALAVMLTLGAAVAAQLLAQPLVGSFLEADRHVGLAAARGALQAAALGWGSLEAFAYWIQLRRRARLGLSEPVLVNRFVLWAISAGAAALGTAIGVAASVVTGRPIQQIPAVLASASAFGLVAALGMWLAFAPPRVYARWIAAGRSRA